MRKESLQQIMDQVTKSEELQGQFGERIDSEALSALGFKWEFQCPAENLQESPNLSDEELNEWRL